MSSPSLDDLMSRAKEELEMRHQAREEVLRQSRQLIQTCSKAIKKIHREDLAGAEADLLAARSLSLAMRSAASASPEVLYAGYIQDSEKELAEAACLLCLIQGQPIPSWQDLGIGLTSWLNGLGEAASEGRRKLLDELRGGRHGEAERLMKDMEAIYDELTTFDFPDGLTGGLRRTCDALRAVIERTRSDLTLTGVQLDLMRALQQAQAQQD